MTCVFIAAVFGIYVLEPSQVVNKKGPNTVSVSEVAKGHTPSTHLCLAELAAVGLISDEVTLHCVALLSFGPDKDKLPVLRRRPDGTLATLAFRAAAAAARLLS